MSNGVVHWNIVVQGRKDCLYCNEVTDGGKQPGTEVGSKVGRRETDSCQEPIIRGVFYNGKGTNESTRKAKVQRKREKVGWSE